MLEALKQWVVGEQGRLSGFIQGRLSLDAARDFEQTVRKAGFLGVFRVTRAQYGEFTLEGPKAKLEKFLLGLPHARGMNGAVLKISWAPPQGKFSTFRMTLE